jgi:hypothetical protein
MPCALPPGQGAASSRSSKWSWSLEQLFTTIGRINAKLTGQRTAGVAPMDVKIEGDVRGQARMCGPTTQLRVFATLRAALNAAVKQRKVTWNPCDGDYPARREAA